MKHQANLLKRCLEAEEAIGESSGEAMRSGAVEQRRRHGVDGVMTMLLRIGLEEN